MKKNNLKRATAAALAAVLAMGALASCSGTNSSKNSNGQTVISVGGWPQKEGKDLENSEAKKARFEESNPDVFVEPNAWTFEFESFYAKAAGGQLPTVFGTNFTEVPQVVAGDYGADMTSALEKYGLADKIQKNIKEVISSDGKIYAYPTAAYALGMSYNVDLMKAAGLMEEDGTPKQPKDWEEVREFAVKIKEATGKPGIMFPTASNFGGWMFMPLAWSYGVDFMDQDADGKWQATFDTPEAAEALQYIKDLKWKYDVLPSNSLIGGDDYYKIFGTGGAGMIIAAGDVPNSVNAYDMKPEQIGMFAMPKGPKRHVTLLGGNVTMISGKSDEDQVDAAVRWIMVSNNPDATDEYKKGKEEEMEKKLANNELVGIKLMQVWDGECESVKFMNDLIDKNANSNINHVKLYNDFVADLGDCELQPEEPVCAQELYATIDSCIQEVLENENADCAEILKGACADFQANYLDNLD